MLLTLLIFLIILSILVLIHEAGHFLVAKKLGVKVEEFGYGIPPRLWGKKIGETIYSINWLPFGGFVKLYGEDEAGAGRVGKTNNKQQLTPIKSGLTVNKKDEERAFFSRPVRQRAVIVVAGVVMNLFLAFVIYYVYFGISNFKTDLPLILPEYKFSNTNQTNYNLSPKDAVISFVTKDSPAAKAAIKTPAKVLEIDGIKVANRKMVIDEVDKAKGKPVSILWENVKTGLRGTATITPRINPPKGEGPLGVGFLPVVVLTYQSPAQKIFSGIVFPLDGMKYQLAILKKLIAISFQEKTISPVGEAVGGPVQIFNVVSIIWQIPDMKERVLQLLNLAGILSVTLAFFNVLPIPALDGGRLFFILIEGIFRKKLDPKLEGVIHSVGMAVLLAIIFLVTAKDIISIFPK